ncbi:MAG TPA: hypothetical protein VGL78_04315 [Solirubrobacteraceae bacterium]|jgi:hypothetical protein
MTRRSRRPLSHLVAIAGLSGLITLAVALTDADDVWLAVGPLLLVILDTLGFSPVVQSRARKAARLLRGLAPPKQRGFVTDVSRRWHPAPASYSYRRGGLAVPLGIAALVLAIGFGLNIQAPIWAFVTGNAVTLGIAALVIVLALSTLQIGVTSGMRYYKDPTPGWGPPGPWLQDQLTAAGDSPRSIVVLKPTDITAPSLTTACANVFSARLAQLHHLSETELLIVAKPEDLTAALSFFGLGPMPLQPSERASAGEVTYPKDGRDPDALIREARLRMAARDE